MRPAIYLSGRILPHSLVPPLGDALDRLSLDAGLGVRMAAAIRCGP